MADGRRPQCPRCHVLLRHHNRLRVALNKMRMFRVQHERLQGVFVQVAGALLARIDQLERELDQTRQELRRYQQENGH
ncbi:hypothetical protein L596_025564 [Steinernema carpocapsae]|uniref:Uncharacterized protein n=1 Tax=Steinernema carpocapsae TaxID=34508 RepID=A0A4U5M850_STECR|nr:hypothetical protein L596_025564 [Steinernema carpocapsae]